MITIACMEPEHPGNIGAIARVMKNFAFHRLLLINPKCEHLSREALDRAAHAKEILQKARVGGAELLKPYDYCIGTTSVLGTDYNIPRSPLTPIQLAEKIAGLKKKKRRIVLLFGREGSGLSNEELLACDFVVTIPADRAYPALNLSHALAVVLYEIYQAIGEQKVQSHILPAVAREKNQILLILEDVLQHLDFSRPYREETQRRVWKRMIGKAMLTKREAFAVMGFLKRVLKKVKR